MMARRTLAEGGNTSRGGTPVDPTSRACSARCPRGTTWAAALLGRRPAGVQWLVQWRLEFDRRISNGHCFQQSDRSVILAATRPVRLMQ